MHRVGILDILNQRVHDYKFASLLGACADDIHITKEMEGVYVVFPQYKEGQEIKVLYESLFDIQNELFKYSRSSEMSQVLQQTPYTHEKEQLHIYERLLFHDRSVVLDQLSPDYLHIFLGFVCERLNAYKNLILFFSICLKDGGTESSLYSYYWETNPDLINSIRSSFL